MFNTLVNFIDNTKNEVITKDGILTLHEYTFNTISANIIPTLNELSDDDNFFNSDPTNTIGKMSISMGLKTLDAKIVIKKLSKFFNDVSNEDRNIVKLIEKELPDRMFTNLSNPRVLAILKTVSDLSSISLYVLDVLYMAIADVNDTEYPKGKVADISAKRSEFSAMISTYSKSFKDHVKKLGKVSVNQLDPKANSSIMNSLFNEHGSVVDLPFISGFTNNPIYHIRLWLVDRDVDKYESIKDKKRLIEIKLTELKLSSAGHHDERINKQIAYYEDKVLDMEESMRDLED